MFEMEFLGDNKKVPNRRFFSAASFMLPCLVKRSHIDQLFVTVSFLKEDRMRDADGWTLKEGLYSYYVWIRNSAPRKKQLTALAHELVHVKQDILGEGAINSRIAKASPDAEHVDDYWDDPLEIEAYGREQGLVDRFLRWESLNEPLLSIPVSAHQKINQNH